jgi:hypothetical protein
MSLTAAVVAAGSDEGLRLLTVLGRRPNLDRVPAGTEATAVLVEAAAAAVAVVVARVLPV